MAGKTKSKAAKYASKKKNKASQKAKAAALNEADDNGMAGDGGVTQEQVQAAGGEIDNATQYTDSLHSSDESDDDVSKLEAENKENEMPTREKVKQIGEESETKKSSYPGVSLEFATETFETGAKKSSYPAVAAHHATTNLRATDSGSMGPPPRKSSLAPQYNMSADGLAQDFGKLGGALGVYNAILLASGGRPLPSTPVIGGNGNVDTTVDASAMEYLDNSLEKQLQDHAKRALDEERGAADINAFALTKQKEMEEGQAQEEEYDPAELDLNSGELKDIQRNEAFYSSGDKMDYVMGTDQENETAANSGNVMHTPTTSEEGAPHNLVVECSSKEAADAIGGHLIDAAENEDITKDITNVSVVSAAHSQASDQTIGPNKFPSGLDATQLDDDSETGSEIPGMDIMKSIFTSAMTAHVKGDLPKPGQGSVSFNPLANQTLATISKNGEGAKDASEKGKENEVVGEHADVDWDEFATQRDNVGHGDGAKEPKLGGGGTLVAIDDELIDLDEAVPKAKSKKKSKSKNRNRSKAVTENASASASGTDDSYNASEEQVGTSNKKGVNKQQVTDFMAELVRIAVPLQQKVDQNYQTVQEVSAKIGVLSKLVSRVNGEVADVNCEVKLVKSEVAVLKESDRRLGLPGGDGDGTQVTGSADGFMGVTYHTFQEDFKAIRELMNERRDISARSIKDIQDVLKEHLREHHGHPMKIPEVLSELQATRETVGQQLNVVIGRVDEFDKRLTKHGETMVTLSSQVKILRIAAAGSGSAGAALGKAMELEATIANLAVKIGTATRTLDEFSVFTKEDLAKHEKVIATMKSDIAGLHKVTKATKSTVDEHVQELAALKLTNQQNSQGVTTVMANLESDVNSSRSTNRKVDRLIAEQNTMKKNIDKNEKNIGDLFAATESSMTKFEGQHEKFESDMKKQDGKLAKVDKKLSSMDGRIGYTTNRLETTNSQVNKIVAAFEREIGPVELEVDENGAVIVTESLREKIGKLLKKRDDAPKQEGPKKKWATVAQVDAKVEALTELVSKLESASSAGQTDISGAVVDASVKALTERVSKLETATSTGQTDIAAAVIATTKAAVPGAPQLSQSDQPHPPRVRLPHRDRVTSKNAPATPGAPSPAPMAPHPTPPGSATMPPPMMGLGLPAIPEETPATAAQTVFSPAMGGAMQMPVGASNTPVMNLVNAPIVPMPMHGKLVPAMMGGPQGLMPGSGVPPQAFGPGPRPGPGCQAQNFAPLINGPPHVNRMDSGTPQPVYHPGPDAVQNQLLDHFNIMQAMGTRINQVENAASFHRDELRRLRQDVRYEIGIENTRMEQELTERFRYFGNHMSAIEDEQKSIDDEQKRLEGQIVEIMKFVGMPAPELGEKKQSMESMVLEIMSFVKMPKPEGFGESRWGV